MTDLVALYNEAIEKENTWGRDHGNGWLLRHPIKKMLIFQQFCLNNPSFLGSKCKIKAFYNDEDSEYDEVSYDDEPFGSPMKTTPSSAKKLQATLIKSPPRQVSPAEAVIPQPSPKTPEPVQNNNSKAKMTQKDILLKALDAKKKAAAASKKTTAATAKKSATKADAEKAVSKTMRAATPKKRAATPKKRARTGTTKKTTGDDTSSQGRKAKKKPKVAQSSSEIKSPKKRARTGTTKKTTGDDTSSQGRKAKKPKVAQSSSKVKSPKDYIGSKVTKKFSGKFYNGKCDSYKKPYWKIVFDDGDEEEFEEEELKEAIRLYEGRAKKVATKK